MPVFSVGNYNLAKLQAILTPAITVLGYTLWGCIADPHRRLVRVYIDSHHGITLADCERVSRQASAILSVHEPMMSTYHLEISSPGLDRPLFTAEQYRRFIGARVHIRTYTLIENRRNFVGILQAVLPEGASIRLDSPKTKHVINKPGADIPSKRIHKTINNRGKKSGHNALYQQPIFCANSAQQVDQTLLLKWQTIARTHVLSEI